MASLVPQPDYEQSVSPFGIEEPWTEEADFNVHLNPGTVGIPDQNTPPMLVTPEQVKDPKRETIMTIGAVALVMAGTALYGATLLRKKLLR